MKPIVISLLALIIMSSSCSPQDKHPKEVKEVIAFVKSMDLKGASAQQIYLIDEDGSNVRNISNNPEHMDEDPAWSLDGEKIVFSSTRNGIDFEIYVMDADGSNIKQLTKCKQNKVENKRSPAWSLDGKKIAFDSKIYDKQSDNEKWDIYVMNADGSDIVKLTNSKDSYDYNASPAWSPDGKRIAFVHTAAMWVMDSDGSNGKRLIEPDNRSTFVYTTPAWSPDGKKIAFQSDEHGGSNICVIDADGSNIKSLTNNKANNRHPTWSPDGKKIAFESTRNKRRDIYIMDADGSNERKLTNNDNISKAGIEYPAWSPVKENKKGDITPPPK